MLPKDMLLVDLLISIPQLAVLMLLLCACGGDRPQPKSAILPPHPAKKAVAMPKPKLLWPQASELKDLPNYGKTSRVFTRFQNASAGEKFFQAYQARRPGRWEEKANTIEGDPFFTRFYYLGKGTAVYVEHDARQDKFSNTAITQELCNRLVPSKTNQELFSQEKCQLIKTLKKFGQ